MTYSFNDYCLYVITIIKNKCYLVNRKLRKKLKLRRKKNEKNRYGKPLLGSNEVQETISELIISREPFMVARFGGIESNVCFTNIGVNLGIKRKISEKLIKKVCINAGFFPANEEAVVKFGNLMEESIKSVDVLGSMKANLEEYLVRKNLSENSCLTEIGNLEPYYSDNPWTKALKGKKVLVIHPFVDTITKQYEKRQLLFPDGNILPEFDLQTIKAVQSIAGTETKYNDWFEALDAMYEQAMALDFEIAIIGCGAYGLPLAAKIKNSGKQAIHLGGAVQILFGIKGERWKSVPEVKKFFNEYWVHPSTNEVPENAKMVEGGCYW